MRTTRDEENKTSIPCNYNRRTSAADLGQIARSRHSDIELRALATNDWTIRIGFVQCALQLAASGTAAMTCLAKLAGLAGRWQHTRGNKRRSVYNLFARVQQHRQRLAAAAPVNTGFGRGAPSGAPRFGSANAPPPRGNRGHGSDAGLQS